MRSEQDIKRITIETDSPMFDGWMVTMDYKGDRHCCFAVDRGATDSVLVNGMLDATFQAIEKQLASQQPMITGALAE